MQFTDEAGCDVGELSAIWSWVEDNKWPFFSLFLLTGLFLTFLGNYFLMPILFIAGVAQASFLIMLICYNTFLFNEEKVWVGWLVIVLSAVVGLGVGFIFMKFQKVGTFCLAAWGGFSIGLLFYNAFIYKIDNDAALWGFSIAFGLLYGLCVFFIADHILIHATAIIGSFLTVFGIGLVAGHYPNPFTIVELIKHGQIEGSIDPLFYAYFGGNIVLCLLGCFVQYRHRKDLLLKKELKE